MLGGIAALDGDEGGGAEGGIADGGFVAVGVVDGLFGVAVGLSPLVDN
jgi:hypothetical protein